MTEPTWRLRERLRREAAMTILGRKLFERDQLGGRKSDKPLPPVEADPRDLVRLIDATDERAEAWDKGAEAGFDAKAPDDLPAVLARNPYRERAPE